MANKPRFRVWTYTAIGLLGAVVLVALPSLFFGKPAHPGFLEPVRILTLTAVAIIVVVWGFVFARLAFRSADEFMREGSKVSWYWGGLMGLAASMPIYVFVMLGGLHWLMPSSPVGPQLARAFGLGYGLPIVTQLAGFFIVAAWWRLSKR